MIVVIVYLLLKYWPQAVATAPASNPTTGAPGQPNFNATGNGDPAFLAAFGGGNTQFPGGGNTFAGPIGQMNGSQGNFAKGIIGNGIFDFSNTGQGNVLAGPVPTSFGNCSTNPRDGKPLCA